MLQPHGWKAPLPGRDGKPFFITYQQAYDRGVQELQSQRAALDTAMHAEPKAQPIGPSNTYDPLEDPYSGWFGNEPPAAP